MNQRDRRAIFAGGLLILVAVIYRFGFSSAFAQWQQVRAESQQQLTLLDGLESKLERRGQILRRLEPRFGPGVGRPIPAAEDAAVAFPRTVQEAVGRGGGKATQLEVQGTRRLRDLPGIDLLSLRLRVDCPAESIPEVLRQLQAADLPVILESINFEMARAQQRDQWQATLVVSTPTLSQGRGS